MKKTIISLIIIIAVLGGFALSCYADALTPSSYTTSEYYENDTKYYKVALNSVNGAIWRTFYNGSQVSESNGSSLSFPSGFIDEFYCAPSLDRQPRSIFSNAPADYFVVTYRFDFPLFGNLGRPSFDSIYADIYCFRNVTGSQGMTNVTIAADISPYVPGETGFTVSFKLPLSSIDRDYFTIRSVFDLAQSAEWNGASISLVDFYYLYSESVWDILFTQSSEVDEFVSNIEIEFSGVEYMVDQFDSQVEFIVNYGAVPSDISILDEILAVDFQYVNGFWSSEYLAGFMALFATLGGTALVLVLLRRIIIG